MDAFKPMNRRKFLKISMSAALAVPFALNRSGFSQVTVKCEDVKALVKEDYPTAKAFMYKHKFKDLDKATLKAITERAKKGTKPNCQTCMWYKKCKMDKKEGELGVCQMLQGFFVKADGSCNVWQPKSN